MLINLPSYDLNLVNALSVVHAAHARTAMAVADAELAAAAHLIRKIWPTADRLIVEKTTTDDGHTDITMLVLLARDDVLWFDSEWAYDYPGAQLIADDRHRPHDELSDEASHAIEAHLRDAYDVLGGCGRALSTTGDDHFGAWKNLLELDLARAADSSVY